MSEKKVLILGAGRGQVDLYKAAKKIGARTVAVSIPGDYPGFPYADEIEYVDIRDKEGVLKAAEKHGADAVVTACVDIPVPAVGYVCDRMGLKGISHEAAVVSTNKLLMKRAFEKDGVRTARFVECMPGDDPVSVSSHLNYPLIVKPVDLAGSRGIQIVENERDLSEAVGLTMSETSEDYCIIEEYIDGYEFSATAFVLDGEILFVLPMGDVRYGENDEIPAGHYLPYEDEPGVLEDFDRQMRAGIRALGLDNCAVNADVMRKDGKVYIIEMTGRLGANCIPELTSIYMGYDIDRMIVEAALGEKGFLESIMDGKAPETPCYAQMIISEKSGILKDVHVDSSVREQADILFFSKPGNEIRKFSCTNDCVGQIVTSGRTLEEAKEKAAAAAAGITLDLE